jgi:hypothetical protein
MVSTVMNEETQCMRGGLYQPLIQVEQNTIANNNGKVLGFVPPPQVVQQSAAMAA